MATYSLLVLVVNLATKTLVVVDLVLQGESVVLKTVASLNALTGSLVLLGVLLSFGDHAVNLILGKTTLVVGNGDRLLLASALVVGRDLENSVGIELEGDLDLGNATGRGGDASELELAEEVVVLSKGTFTLVNLDKNDGLVVGGGGEDLALAGRDGGVALDKLGHDASSGLDTESQGVDVHEDDVLSTLLTGKDTGLNGGTESDGLIGVDTLGSLLSTEVLLNEVDNLGNTGRATNENDVVNILLLDLGVLEHLLNGLEGLLEEIHVELLELGAGKSLREVLALEEGFDLNASGHLGREGTLRLLGLTLELTHGLEVLGDVDTVLLVVGLGEEVDDALVEILTTQVGVTGGSQNLEDTLVDGQEGNIESTTTKVVDDDLALTLGLVKTVGDSGGGRLVDNAENVKSGNDTSILGGLALVVVEVGGNSDDGVGDLLAKVGLGDLLHLAQDHGGNLLGGEALGGARNLDLDDGLAILLDDLVGEVLDVGLNRLVGELLANHTPERMISNVISSGRRPG